MFTFSSRFLSVTSLLVIQVVDINAVLRRLTMFGVLDWSRSVRFEHIVMNLVYVVLKFLTWFFLIGWLIKLMLEMGIIAFGSKFAFIVFQEVPTHFFLLIVVLFPLSSNYLGYQFFWECLCFNKIVL